MGWLDSKPMAIEVENKSKLDDTGRKCVHMKLINERKTNKTAHTRV